MCVATYPAYTIIVPSSSFFFSCISVIYFLFLFSNKQPKPCKRAKGERSVPSAPRCFCRVSVVRFPETFVDEYLWQRYPRRMWHLLDVKLSKHTPSAFIPSIDLEKSRGLRCQHRSICGG